MQTRWPWISILLAAALALNPLGIDFLRSAFSAGEQLTRDIARPLVLTAAAAMGLLAVIEWLVRIFISRRRARGARA